MIEHQQMSKLDIDIIDDRDSRAASNKSFYYQGPNYNELYIACYLYSYTTICIYSYIKLFLISHPVLNAECKDSVCCVMHVFLAHEHQQNKSRNPESLQSELSACPKQITYYICYTQMDCAVETFVLRKYIV